MNALTPILDDTARKIHADAVKEILGMGSIPPRILAQKLKNADRPFVKYRSRTPAKFQRQMQKLIEQAEDQINAEKTAYDMQLAASKRSHRNRPNKSWAIEIKNKTEKIEMCKILIQIGAVETAHLMVLGL